MDQWRRRSLVRGSRREQRPQVGAQAEIGESGDRSAGLGGLHRGDPAGEREPEVGERRGPHLARGHGHTGPVERLAGRVTRRVGDRGRQGQPAAVVTAAAVVGGRVVETFAQEAQPAAVGGEVVEHRGLLLATSGGDAFVTVAVIDPRLTGGHPAALLAADSAVDVEHLEHHLEAGAPQVDVGLQGRGRGGPPGFLEGTQGRADVLFGREGQRGEVAPDVAVLR